MRLGARDGLIWVAHTPEGLVIAGVTDGKRPEWPETAEDMATSDHLEVWFSDPHPPELPPIGWGNQFDDATLESDGDCIKERPEGEEVIITPEEESCIRWFSQQIRYRPEFTKLFVRHWEAAPGIVQETYATSAFDAFPDSVQEKLAPLRPRTLPQALFSVREWLGDSYSFELLIPWAALPPASSLGLRDIRLLVDIFNPVEGTRRYMALMSTSAKRQAGAPETFNQMELSEPRNYQITACRYLPRGVLPRTANWFGYSRLREADLVDAYFTPTDIFEVTDVIVIHNEARGYAYEPFGHSPVVSTTRYFERTIGDDVTICGPRLAVSWDDGEIVHSQFTIEDSFETLRLDSGDLLVKNGPRAVYSYYGSGQCGACPRIGLSIFHVDGENKAVAPLMEFLELSDGGFRDIDISMSAAWDTVDIFRSRPDEDLNAATWSLTRHCLRNEDALTYEVCLEQDSVPEPEPRGVAHQWQ